MVSFSLKCDLGTSPLGRDVFLLEDFSTDKSANETLNNYSVKTQATGLRRLEVRKIAADGFVVSTW
jgi:hypothetical protein